MPQLSQTDNRIILEGDLVLHTVAELDRELRRLLQRTQTREIVLDGSGITALDTAGAALLAEIERFAQARGVAIELTDIPPQFQRFMDFVSIDEAPPSVGTGRTGILERIGERAYVAYQGLVDLTLLTADVAYWSVAGLFDRSGTRKGTFVEQAVRVGSQALPIVGLILFLIGFVTSLQSAAQLRQFGANIFVADLLAIGITRELGPLMTAIIVSGRSGSAIAAEIATMKFTEELDALRTMALDPVRFVIVPKFWAMTICVPLLTVMADVLGILGGFTVAVTYLEIGPEAFMNQIASALMLKDVLTGLVKSVSFAWVIIIVAAYRGLHFRGGAEGVGIATTSSVVTSIFMIIVVDSFWGIVFYF